MNAVMMTKMTSDDLIDELQSELNNINADKVDDYEQSYIWIRSRVNKLAASDYPLYKDLEDYFEDFIQWEDVRERLLAAVEDRDSSTLGFLTRQVDLDDEYYYFDANGFLLNIDEDAICNLIDNLLYRLRR
ncbi:MAG: hypothetical protein IJF84_00345 [Thermoguttaceae bacterium]|nr:hypothetical protein [Thermoguttaceae bacterium]